MSQNFEWELLKSHYILEDKWISVRADTCRMPKGHIIEPYYIVESMSWVSIVPVTTAGEVVLVRLYRHGVRQTVWELPGGLIDAEDGNAFETCRRELLEETGYLSEDISRLGQGFPDPARYQATVTYFLANNARLVADPEWEESEEMAVVTVPIPRLLEMLWQGEIVDTAHQSALFFALRTLGYLAINESGHE